MTKWQSACAKENICTWRRNRSGGRRVKRPPEEQGRGRAQRERASPKRNEQIMREQGIELKFHNCICVSRKFHLLNGYYSFQTSKYLFSWKIVSGNTVNDMLWPFSFSPCVRPGSPSGPASPSLSCHLLLRFSLFIDNYYHYLGCIPSRTEIVYFPLCAYVIMICICPSSLRARKLSG